jgi:hypothetical protein
VTDNLHDRIAAVLLAHQENSDTGPDCTCGWEWQGGALWKDSYASHVADAVIAALGLQSHLAKRIINGKPDQWVRRHVTDWEILDD